jgi:hypothetical protein
MGLCLGVLHITGKLSMAKDSHFNSFPSKARKYSETVCVCVCVSPSLMLFDIMRTKIRFP